MYEKVHMHIYAVIEVDVDVLGTKSGNFSPFKKNHQIKLFGGEVEYRHFRGFDFRSFNFRDFGFIILSYFPPLQY